MEYSFSSNRISFLKFSFFMYSVCVCACVDVFMAKNQSWMLSSLAPHLIVLRPSSNEPGVLSSLARPIDRKTQGILLLLPQQYWGHSTMPDILIWVRGIWTQFCTLAWHVHCQLSYLPSLMFAFFLTLIIKIWKKKTNPYLFSILIHLCFPRDSE